MPAQFAHATTELASQEGSQGDAVGIPHLGSYRVDTRTSGTQSMDGVLDAQVLEVGQRSLAQYAFQATRQRAFAGADGPRRLDQRETFREPPARPAFEALDHRIGVRQMVGDDIDRLRGSLVHHEVV